jgi:hypothetical protein
MRLWRMLRERDPAAAVVLDRLEAERAPYLAELSRALGTHLDHEEAEAVGP